MSRTHQFLEDALMHRLGTLIMVLTLALAPFALPAQSPTDLADVCKVLGDAKPGQWASFDGTGSSGVGKLRLAVVGSERAGDSTFYWFEVSFAGKDPGKSGVVQILTGSLASGLESPRALVFKVGPQPAMRISGEMAGMMGKQGGQNASAFDWAGKCGGAHVVGWESVTVPAGTFRAPCDDGGRRRGVGVAGRPLRTREDARQAGRPRAHRPRRGRQIIHQGEADGDARDANAQRLRFRNATGASPRRPCGVRPFRAYVGDSVPHPLRRPEPRVRSLVDPRRRHTAPAASAPCARPRLRLHGVRRAQVARDRDLPRRAQRRRRGFRVPGG